MKKILLLLVCVTGGIIVKAQEEPPPPPPPPKPPPKVEITKFTPSAKELKEFYNRNPDVSSLYWKSEKEIVVVHKDKTQFVYNTKSKEEVNAFEEKYGKTPSRPPVIVKAPKDPPPPPPKPKN